MGEFGKIVRRPGRLMATALLLPLAAGAAFASDAMPAPDACFAEAPGIPAEAAGVRDAMTVRLKDGGEVRLAGLFLPRDRDGGPMAVAAERAAAALDALVAGRRIALHMAEQKPDRHGRLVAQVRSGDADGFGGSGRETLEGASQAWLQAALVRAGMAQVMPGAGTPDCAAGLLALEREARAARRGFWGSGPFSVVKADAIPEALLSGGNFAIVETEVRRIGEAGGRLFLDSRTRYWGAFTIVIPRDAQPAFAAAGVDLRSLSGRRVRARGVLFSWNGPAMELRVPAALELIEAEEG